jgi:hypothetical protein
VDDSLYTKVLSTVAILFAVLAGGIWFVFLRPVPIKSAVGEITRKTFKPAGTYWQYPPGLDRGFRTATPIPVAEAYVFEITVDEFGGPAFYSLNTVASQVFNVGKRVQIRYQERGIPFIWQRVYVVDMSSE